MGFSNTVSVEDLQPGYHVYCYRGFFTYAHHGIYIGDAKVIHFVGDKNVPKKWCSNCQDNMKGRNGVFRTCLDCFRNGQPLRRFFYGVSAAKYKVMRAGTCSTLTEDPPAIAISRAHKALSTGFPQYHLLRNNCEIFCMYCTTGSVKAPDLFSSSSSGSGQVRFAINAVHMASAAVTMIGQVLESQRKHLQEDEMVDEEGNQPRHINKMGSAEGPSSSCLLQKQNVGIIDSLAMTGLGKVLRIAGIVGSLVGVVAAVHAQPQQLQEYEEELVMNGCPGLGTI